MMHTHNGSSPPEVIQMILFNIKIFTKLQFYMKSISIGISFDFIHGLYFDSRISPKFDKNFEDFVDHLINDIKIHI